MFITYSTDQVLIINYFFYKIKIIDASICLNMFYLAFITIVTVLDLLYGIRQILTVLVCSMYNTAVW